MARKSKKSKNSGKAITSKTNANKPIASPVQAAEIFKEVKNEEPKTETDADSSHGDEEAFEEDLFEELQGSSGEENINTPNQETEIRYENLDSNKLRTTLFALKKINIKRYASKLKAYHTTTNFYNAVVNSIMANASNVVDVPGIWQYKNPSKRYLNHPKFYINKPKFELPKLVEMTGVGEMRDSEKPKLEEEKIEELNKISQYRISGSINNGVVIDYETNYNLLIKMGANTYMKKSSLLPFGKVFADTMDLENLNSENDTKNIIIDKDIRVGKLSKELLDVLGIRSNKNKGAFPYWCKISNFNNKVKNIMLNQGKGIIDDDTGEYCSIEEERSENDSEPLKLFGRKVV